MNLATVKLGDITEWPTAEQIAAADRTELRVWLNGLPLPKTNGHCITLRAICDRLATLNGAEKQPRTLPMPAAPAASTPPPAPAKPAPPPEPPPLTNLDFLAQLRA
jgi:hypothetical protein